MVLRCLTRWLAIAIAFLAVLVPVGMRGVSAAGNPPPGPDRYTVVLQKYTSYEWWLTNRTDNSVVCTINVDHEGLPTGGDIYTVCGETIYDNWINTKACPKSSDCSGYYLQFIKSEPAERKVGVKQPPPMVWVTLDGCTPYNLTFRCDNLPTLTLTGEEPIPGEQITSLAGEADGKPFECDATCQIDLAPTDDYGLDLQFWAYSSYGDSSEVFTARVRVARSADTTDQSWYVDVLSDQWRGEASAGCSMIWDEYPTVGGTPDWLSTPSNADDLATNVSYEYLAAHLIKNSAVDSSSCSDGGLLEDGTASPCGLEVARPAVDEWQNRFDNIIFNTALQTGVPARLLKNIFARESQFWPGILEGHPEAGLGQMTDGGADTLLTWDPSFYEQFCPSVLDPSVCASKIYPIPQSNWTGLGLDDTERALVRNALIQSVDAKCPDCSMGIDLDKTESSIGVFAQMLIASCSQTGQVIDLNYNSAPSVAASYEDLWRFTLVNYNAGPGCLGLAVNATNDLGEPLDWQNLSNNLTPACQGAIGYVNDISTSVP